MQTLGAAAWGYTLSAGRVPSPELQLSDFDYDLPRELIAQEPCAERDGARLLVHRGAGCADRHRLISDLVDELEPGDLLVVNDTRVRRARLFVVRPSGGRVELLLLGSEPGQPSTWTALANPARKLRVGELLRIELDGGGFDAHFALEALERLPHEADPDKPGPAWRLTFRSLAEQQPGAAALEALIERVGHVPLPPYITRHQGQGQTERLHEERDAERYQTVFAREPGAVAAPTAGLHLTEQLLAALAAKGVERASVTLHVGHGTFAPVEVEDLAQHHMHTESYELTRATVDAIEACRARGGRVVAVGTTSVRVLESAVDTAGRLVPGRGQTDIFITPGYDFRQVDLLLTNFHLPRSTLLMLVSAFIGHQETLRLYQEAVERRYRFFSFGDAMLLTRAVSRT